MSVNAQHVVCMSAALALLGGCVMDQASNATGQAKPTEQYVQNLDTPLEKFDTPASVPAQPAALATGAAVSMTEIDQMLRERSAEYAQVAREARTRGIVGGAIRGGLIGVLIDADPATVIGGAVVGGMIGAASSDKVVSQIVTEHRNYLIRRWSLEKVVAAARTDTGSTRFDLILSDRYLKTARRSGSQAIPKRSTPSRRSRSRR